MRALFSAVLALLACSLQAGCAAAPSGPNADPAQPRGKRKSSDRYFHPETLAFNRLDYDLHFADNLFLLYRDPRVLAVDCSSPGYLSISVSDASVASSWAPETLLVGDKSLGCFLDGKVKPFYRGVVSVEVNGKNSDHSAGSEISSILVETSQANVENCFKEADIKFRSVPVGHKEHPIFPSKESLREGLNSTTRRQLRSWLPDIDFNWRVGFGPLSLNYDENAKNGDGGARNPSIPIFKYEDVRSLEEEGEGGESEGKGNGVKVGASVSVKCQDCYTTYSHAGISFALKIKTGFHYWVVPYAHFEYLELTIDGEFVVSFGLAIDIFMKASLLDSGRVTLIESPHEEISFLPEVPFWIDLYGQLQAQTTLDFLAHMSVSTGFYYEAAYKYGFRYSHHDGFRTIQEMTNEFGSHLTFDSDVKLELGLHFYLELVANMWDSIPVAVGPSFSVILDIGFDIDVYHAESQLLQECVGLGYQLSYMLGFGLRVEEISIGIPYLRVFGRIEITDEAFGLTIPIIKKTPFPFDWASGCWTLDDHPEVFAYWKPGKWSECPVTCGGGEMTRTVKCVDADGEEVHEERCTSEEAVDEKFEKPSTSQRCNDFSCKMSDSEIVESQCTYNTLELVDGTHWKGIRSRCTWDLFYNNDCDEDCNTPQCKQDNGWCKEKNEKYEACETWGSDSCEKCLQVENFGANCGWCKSTNRCLPGSLTGPAKDRACPSEDWEADTCVAPELPLNLFVEDAGWRLCLESEFDWSQSECARLFLDKQDFPPGGTLDITWSGGKADAEVKMALSLNGSNIARDGFGLPTDEVPTEPAIYTWIIPCDLEPGAYFLAIASSSDSTNYNASRVFEVTYPRKEWCDRYERNNGEPQPTLSWSTLPWSSCSRECDGFYSIGCFNSYFGVSMPEVFELLSENDISLTPQHCASLARKQGLPFAAMTQIGTDVGVNGQCYGGYGWQADSYSTPNPNCDISCQGDSSLTCGGILAIEIFEVPGFQTREVQCIQDVWTIYEEKKPEDYCKNDPRITEDKPYESRACNLDLKCRDRPLNLNLPALTNRSEVFQAGSDIEINWHGGTLYGQVAIQVQQTRSGIFGAPLNETVSPWQQSEVGLPDTVENDGSFTWSVPSDLPSGRYLIRVVSASDESNQAVLSDPIRIRGTHRYSLMSVPYYPNLDASTLPFPDLNLLMVGTLGSASAEMYNDSSLERGFGVRAWSVHALDVGRITTLNYSYVNGPAEMQIGALVVHDGFQLHQVGASLFLQQGQYEASPVCDHFSGSCVSCTRTPGCGYCAASSKCMATLDVTGMGRPIFGWCPESSWSQNADVCDAGCRRVNTCDRCLGTTGCGWCAETCECLAKSSGGGTAFDVGTGLLKVDGQCPSGWLGSLPNGQKCEAAKGDKCNAKPVEAQLTYQVQMLKPGWANLLVDASETTDCQTCESLDCGAHGYCKAAGPNVRCICTDGYSGESCKDPPETCYGIDCSGRGFCYVSGEDGVLAEEHCACLPGYSGANCEFEGTSTGSGVQRRLLDTSNVDQFEDSRIAQRRLLDTPDIGIFSVGCFEARACGNALFPVWESDEAMTPTACAEKAANFRFPFAAVMEGGRCYGAQSLGEFSTAFVAGQDWPNPSDACRSPCSGIPEITCGGECALKILEIVRTEDLQVRKNGRLIKDISLSVDGISEYHLMNTKPMTQEKAQEYCQDKYFEGKLLTVESAAQLARHPRYIADYYFQKVAESLASRKLDFREAPQSRLQYWMGYHYFQQGWHSSDDSDTTYITEKVDATSPYRSPVTGDCAYGDVVAGEQVAKIFFASCRRSMPFICVSTHPPAPPPSSPPPPPLPPSPEAPYPPFAVIVPAQERQEGSKSSCYSWGLLQEPEGAHTILNTGGIKKASLQEATRSGLYKLYFAVADSQGNKDVKTLDMQVQFSPSPPPLLSPPPLPPPLPSLPLSPPPPPSSPPPSLGPEDPPVDPCEICSLCVGQMYQGVQQLDKKYIFKKYIKDVLVGVHSNPAFDATPLESACSQGKGTFSSEESCSQMVLQAKSEDFLAYRAGALCNVLGSCNPSDKCIIEQTWGGAQQLAMDFCTADGTVTGLLVGNKTAQHLINPNDGWDACFEDSECNGGQDSYCCHIGKCPCVPGAMCDTWAEGAFARVLECQADGLDLIKTQGTCKNPCETARVQDFLHSMNNTYQPCQTQEDCDEGELCEQSPDCKTYFCNPETGLVLANDCDRTCQATTMTLAGAAFQNDGSLVVGLTSSALTYAGACGPLFDAESSDILGQAAECQARDKELHIIIRGDASVVVGNTLRLGSSQRSLVSKVGSVPFAGSTGPISKCSNCVNPRAELTGPTILNRQCQSYPDGEYTFSGGSSTGPSNQPFSSVSWEAVKYPNYERDLGPIDISPQPLLDALSDASNRRSLKVRLSSDTVKQLPDGDYVLSLTVTSFLGTSSTATHAFSREPYTFGEEARPSVILAASDAPYSEGIALEASISTQDFLCFNKDHQNLDERGQFTKVEYQWSCGLKRSGRDEECTILDSVASRGSSSLFIPSSIMVASGIQLGDRLTFNLSASYVGVGKSTDLSKTVEVLGDKLIARLEGPSGDVQMGGTDETIVFSAHDSEDPSDPYDRLEPMRYKFHCERVQDKLKPCFKDVNYFGTVSGHHWVVNTTQFAEPDVQYYMYVTIAKGTEGVNRRSAFATRVVTPRSYEVVHTEITRFCPGDASCAKQHVSTNPLALSVHVKFEGSYDKNQIRYRWSFFPEEVERDLDTENVIILPGGAQSRSQTLVAECLVLADGWSSMAVVSVPVTHPPVCASKDGCLQLSRTESTLPDNLFVADADGWSSDGPLRFEFGLKSEDGASKVVQPMSQKSTFIYRAAVGSHRLYVCACDDSGGRTCSESSIVLRRPTEDYTTWELLRRLGSINFEELLLTGDDAPVWEAIQDVVSHLSAVSDELDQQQKSFVESLLKLSSDAVDSMCNSEVADAGIGLRSINVENSLIHNGMQVDSLRLLQNTAVGLRLLERAQGHLLDNETAGNAMENTYSSGISTTTRARSLLATASAQETARLMDTNFASIGRQLAQITLPGSTSRIHREGASLSILRTSSSESLSSAEIRFSDSAYGDPITKFLGGGFPSWCAGDADCSKQDSCAAVGTYLQDASPYISAMPNLNEALQDGFVEDVEVVSGVLEVQLEYEGKANQLLCDENTEGCQLALMLPLQQSYNASKSHACMRILPSGEGYQAVRSTSQEAVPTVGGLATGVCTSNGLGKHVIVQYTSLPGFGPIGLGPRPERTYSKAFDVHVTVDVTVDGSNATNQVSSLVAREHLMSDISQALAAGLYRLDSDLMGDGQGQMCSDCVKATKHEVLDSGHSLVTLAVHLPDDASTETKEAFKENILSVHHMELLSDSEHADKVKGMSLQEEGALQEDDVLQPEPAPGEGDAVDDDSSNRSAVIGGAVGGAVGGFLFLTLVALIAVYICKKQGILGGAAVKKGTSNPQTFQQDNPPTVEIQRMSVTSNEPGGQSAGREAAPGVPNPDLEAGGAVKEPEIWGGFCRDCKGGPSK